MVGDSSWKKPDTLYEALKKMMDSDFVTSGHIMMYVVNPFLASLGYDITNFNEVKADIEEGEMTVRVSKDLTIVVSLSNSRPHTVDSTHRIYLHIDADKFKLSLYIKALNMWELFGAVDLKKHGEDEMKKAFPLIIRMLDRKSLESTYEQKGTKMFTEGVLTNKLRNKEFDNGFIRIVLANELKNPSELFLTAIAQGLQDKFTMVGEADLLRMLRPLRSLGVVDLLDEVYTPMYTDDTDSSFKEDKTESEDVSTVKEKEPVHTKVKEKPDVKEVEKQQPKEKEPVTPKKKETKKPTPQVPEIEVPSEDVDLSSLSGITVDDEPSKTDTDGASIFGKGSTEKQEESIFGSGDTGNDTIDLRNIFQTGDDSGKKPKVSTSGSDGVDTGASSLFGEDDKKSATDSSGFGHNELSDEGELNSRPKKYPKLV